MKIRLIADKRIEIYIIIELLVVFFINFSTVILNNRMLVSIFFNLSFIIFFILFLEFINTYKKMSIWLILLISLSIFSVILSYSLSDINEFEISKLKYLIFFIVTNTFYYILTKINITNKLYSFTIKISFFILLTDLTSYYLLKNRETIANGITLNFGNPNQTGLWISIIFMFGLIIYSKEVSKIKKFIILVLSMLLIPIIIKTLSRNAILSILFLFLLIFYKKISHQKTFYKSSLIFVIILPCIFLISYLNLINSEFMKNFYFLVSEGKSLTSRLTVWNFGTEIFLNSPIIGSYIQVINYEYQHLHNVAIDICAKYGFLVYFIFVILNYKMISTINKKKINKIQSLALCCLLVVFTQGVFEAGIYSGYCGLDYLIGGFIIISRGVSSKTLFREVVM